MGSSVTNILHITAHNTLQEVYQDPNFEEYGRQCDARLRTDDGTEFQVHSSVLSAKSEFFRGIFSIYDNERNYTVIHGMTSDVLEAILIYLCTGRIDLYKGNMMRVLVAADFLMIESLIHQAKEFIMKNKSVRNCIEIFGTSCRIRGLDMKDECSRQLCLCFEKAVMCSADEAYDLPINDLLYFLGHKSINVSGERFIWSFIEKWVQKDADDRLPMVPELLKCLYMGEIDDELALDIISSQIIQKQLHYKDLNDSQPASNKSRLVTLLGEDIQFIPGARLPPCLYLSTNINEVMMMTYDDSPDAWRKFGRLPESPTKQIRIAHKMYNFYKNSTWARLEHKIDRGAIYDLLKGEYTVMNPLSCEFVEECSGRIYAFGRSVFERHPTESGEVLVYVDEEDEWKEISPMQPMITRETVSANGLLYVIGEKDATMFMQVYDPSSGEWRTASPPIIRRYGMAAEEYRGRIIVTGGYWLVEDLCKGVETYDPARDEWSLYPPLPFYLYDSSEWFVTRGRLYVFGDEEQAYWDDSGEWKTVPEHMSHKKVSPYKIFSIEEKDLVSEIMKKNRAACATEWKSNTSWKDICIILSAL